MSDIDRDVSGFAVAPPKRRPTPVPRDKPAGRDTEAGSSRRLAAVPDTETAPAPPKRAPATTASQSKAPEPSLLPPVRVSVHVPTEMAERLRQVTEERGQTQAEVVFDAQLARGGELQDEIDNEISERGGVPMRVRRRRTGGPSTQLGLSMSEPEAAALKDAAAACHHTLSAHVTQLLDRHLAG